MQIKKIVGPSVILCAGFILAGCTTSYKDVMQDKSSFVKDQFSISNLNAGIVQVINAADSKSFPGSKIVYSNIAHPVLVATGATQLVSRNSTTNIKLAGSLYSASQESESNGIISRDTFGTTYRGILWLRSQFVIPGHTNASRPWEIKEITAFTSAASIKPGGELNYSYTAGGDVQLFNFKKFKLTCKAGDEILASKLNASLQGNYIPLHCQTFDEVGVAIDSSELAYLENYGFALQTKHSTSAYSTDFEATAVQISN